MSLPPAPVLLLGQGYQNRDLLVPVGAARVALGEPPPGLLVSWADVHDDGVKAAAANAAPLSPVLANPGARAYDRSTIGGHKAAASWIQRKAPDNTADWDKTMNEAVEAQQGLNMTGIILPSRRLAGADWPDGLQDVLDAARRAVARHSGSDVMAGLILDEPWITDVRLRRTLLNQFTDLPPQLGVAIHVHWSSANAANEPSALAALRTVVSALSQDNRRVLLAEAGILGWLAVAWGAWGFTAGFSQLSWRRSTAEVRRAKGQPATRVARYFEMNLLHHVRQATHQRLVRETGYMSCPCAFCAGLSPATTSTWDHKLADQHGLYSLANLTDRIAAPRLSDRQARVRSVVDAAVDFEGSLGFRLRGDSRPLHLAAWRAEL